MDFINGVKYARLFNIWPEIKGSAADFDLRKYVYFFFWSQNVVFTESNFLHIQFNYKLSKE